MPEFFSNGYAFTSLRVDGQAVYGENNEVLEEYYVIRAIYAKENEPELVLELCPVVEQEGGEEGDVLLPTDQNTIDGVTVDLNYDHYKVVPEDYEKTPDDLAREASGHYYVTFGSDTIKEYDIAFAGFVVDGVVYTLMDMEADQASMDMLLLMAQEIIEAYAG